ncbi:MAG: SAM-dependent methyltransferase [Clostridium sp.]|nr:SAM-dependent methyltransferase [Clostridium sp.]
MKKSSLDKLSFFFLGLISRFEENEIIFERMNMTFKSDKKQLKSEAIPTDEGPLMYTTRGNKSAQTFKQVLDLVKSQAGESDELILTYEERGKKLIITASDKSVTMATEELKPKDSEEIKETQILHREYLLKPSEASSLLKAIAIMSKDGKIKNDKIRKYNQIDHYVELLEKNFLALKDNKVVTILDVGCGKSYLSFALNYYLTEVLKMKCHFIGIDINEQVIASSIKTQKELGYRNMEFHAMDIKDFDVERDGDVVLSLHACDTATDMALAFGVYKKAGLIVAVPCCHKEMLSTYSYPPFEGILKHGILKARLADTLTDGLRGLMLEEHGYEVSIVEYISPLETPKNLMIRAMARGSENLNAKNEADQIINALSIYPAFRYYLDQYTYGLNNE